MRNAVISDVISPMSFDEYNTSPINISYLGHDKSNFKYKITDFFADLLPKSGLRLVALAASAYMFTALVGGSSCGAQKSAAAFETVKSSYTANAAVKFAGLSDLEIKPAGTGPLFSQLYQNSTFKIESATEIAARTPTQCDFTDDPFKPMQCTWYVFGRAKAVTGTSLAFKDNSGRSARYWLREVIPQGSVSIVKDINAIRTHSIAVFSHGGDSEGHVVFIENVIRDNDGTPESVVFSESNWGKNKAPTQKQLSWNAFLSRSDGSLKGYIYL